MPLDLAAALWLLATPAADPDAIPFDPGRALKNRQRDAYAYALDSCLRERAIYLLHAGATSRRAAVKAAGDLCGRAFIPAVVQRGLMTQHQAQGLVDNLARQAVNDAVAADR